MSFNLGNVCSLPSNYFKPECNCINPPTYIKNAASNMLAPYYCWYAPCLANNAIKTPEIIQGQLDCKIKNCSITIDQINITGGIVTIENNCINSITQSLGKNVNISLEKVKFSTQVPVFPASVMIVLLATAMFLS